MTCAGSSSSSIDVTAIATDQRVSWQGVRMAFGTRGDRGSPVLLLMGFGVPGRAWVHQVPALSARHRVAWYDHRGSGATDAAPGRYTMAQLADDARRLLDHLRWDRAHVVGVSMGGMVAQELALEQRPRLRSLTLIATHAGGVRARLPSARGARLFLKAHSGSLERRFSALARLLFPDDFLARCDRSWLDAVLQADFGDPPPFAARCSQLAAVARHDTRRRLCGLKGLPTLVVKPGRDELVRSEQSDRLARLIPGAQLLELPDAGHGVIRQCYTRVNDALLRHFAAADNQAFV